MRTVDLGRQVGEGAAEGSRMAWVELGGAFVLASALLLVPGLLVAAAAGLRAGWLVGAAAPLSLTVVGIATLAAPRLGLGWSILPVLVTTALVVLLVVLVRWAFRAHWTPALVAHGRPTEWTGLAAVLVAALVLLVRLVRQLDDPASISQTYDASFHLNAVRWIVETGDATPANVADFVSGSGGFYPATFHALAALQMQLTGASLEVAINGLWLALAAVVWPIGIVLLTRTLVGSSRAVLLSAGVLAAGLPAFPLLLTHYGVLYPLLAGYAVLPVVLAFSVRALALGAESTSHPRRVNVPLLLGVALMLPGLVLMHPSAVVAWMAVTTPWVLIAAGVLVRRAPRVLVKCAWVVLALGWLAAVYLVTQASGTSVTWPVIRSVLGALRELALLTLAFDLDRQAMPVLVALLVWIGGIAILVRRDLALDQRLALLAAPLVVGVLYVIVAAIGDPAVRDAVTSPWYSNTPRIVALAPLAVIPVGALGAQSLWRLLLRWREPRRGALWATVALVVMAVGVQSSAALGDAYERVRAGYLFDDYARLVSADEAELLSRLDETVPEDAVIIGNPWTGTALAYALGERDVVFRHIVSVRDPDVLLVIEELKDAEPGDEVCAALDRLDVEYVLDFHPRELRGGRFQMRGIEQLWLSDAAELVDQEGRARLYRVTACD